jgi:hypothetical protein
LPPAGGCTEVHGRTLADEVGTGVTGAVVTPGGGVGVGVAVTDGGMVAVSLGVGEVDVGVGVGRFVRVAEGDGRGVLLSVTTGVTGIRVTVGAGGGRTSRYSASTTRKNTARASVDSRVRPRPFTPGRSGSRCRGSARR